MESKNIDVLKNTGVLPEYTGTLLHDHETALYRFGTAHGECNVHLLRYFKKNTEETDNTWSSDLAELLCDMNSKRKQRKCKNRQKMSGGFRKQTGNEMYCTIMSVIETCKRKEMQVFDNIGKIFEGTPAIF